MQVGNSIYRTREDLPNLVPVFPVLGMLLLPGSRLSFDVFEHCHIMMFDAALSGNRLIGLIQPALSDSQSNHKDQHLSQIGCIGRITSFIETGDGRYIVTLTGVCRFRLLEEPYQLDPWRCFYISPFVADLVGEENDGIDRVALLEVFRNYLAANNLDTDWESIEQTGNAVLVNSLATRSPFSAAEKQALLEAHNFQARAQTLITIMQIVLAHDSCGYKSRLQ